MANLILYGFKHSINIKEDLVSFLCENYPNIQIKYANSKDTCLKILRDIAIDCLIVNQTEENPSLFQLLKSLGKNISYNQIPLIGINTSKVNLNLNISDSFIANLFLPLNYEELKILIESNISDKIQNKGEKGRKFKKSFSFKEKYDTKKSCFSLCEAINDENNNIVDYKFIEINPEFAEFLDLMIEDIYNGTLKTIFPELGPQLVEMFNATPENGKPLYYECHSKRNGKYFDLITYKQKYNIINTIIIDTTQKFIEEENIKKQKEKFGERVKELRCLYNITRILNENNLSIKEILKKMVVVIPWAFKFPEHTKVKISVWKYLEKSNDYKETDWKIEENVIIQKRRIGKISVVYQKKKPKEYIGPFLKDEVNLLRSICEMMSNRLEKWVVQNDLYNMNERLDIAFKAADFGVWDWDLRENKFFLNSKYLEILGENELRNGVDHNFWLERLHPDDKQIIHKNIERNLTGNQDVFYQEFRVKTKTGDWKWIKDTSKIVKRDNLGNPQKIMGMIIDVDKDKRAIIELEYRQQFEKIVKDIVKISSDVSTHKLEEKINKINSDFSKLNGSDFSEIVFLNQENKEVKVKEIIKNSVNGSKSSLKFSMTALKEISQLLKRQKVILIPNENISKNTQNEILNITNCKSLLFIAINKGENVKGYNLHFFKNSNKNLLYSELEILNLYSDLISNILIKLEKKSKNNNSIVEDECLVSNFILGITHELSSPSQYLSDNIDFIHKNTFTYSDVINDLQSLIKDKRMIETSEIEAVLENYVNLSETKKIKNELKEAFNHTKLGIEDVRGICQAVEEFSTKEDVQNFMDLNKLLQTVINFTKNEWKYCFELIITESQNNLMVYGNQNDLRRAFLYLIVCTFYLIKPDKKNPVEKKNINLITIKEETTAVVKIVFDIETTVQNDFANLFDNKIEMRIKNWNIAEKISFCKEVFVNNLFGEVYYESNEQQFCIVVRLPID